MGTNWPDSTVKGFSISCSVPHNEEIMGLNPNRCWVFFSFHPLSNVTSNRCMEDVQQYRLSLKKYYLAVQAREAEYAQFWD